MVNYCHNMTEDKYRANKDHGLVVEDIEFRRAIVVYRFLSTSGSERKA